jgi:hypothetical protein
MWSCDKCGKIDLCADCDDFKRCCDTDDPYTERLRVWNLKNMAVSIVGNNGNLLPSELWQKP